MCDTSLSVGVSGARCEQQDEESNLIFILAFGARAARFPIFFYLSNSQRSERDKTDDEEALGVLVISFILCDARSRSI